MGDFKVLVLAYRRAEGELSTGSFLLSSGDEAPQLLATFEKLSYVEMMKKFAGHLCAHPNAGGAIQRIDRPGLTQIMLPAEEVELFRTDPVLAIRQRMIPPQVVHIGVRPAPPTAPAPVLEAGHAVLAECFGDNVYARYRKHDVHPEVECHVCGAWSALEEGPSYTCWSCHRHLTIADLSAEWAGVAVKDLLATSADKFFLPRAWNNHRNWVTREALQQRFTDYNKEKGS